MEDAFLLFLITPLFDILFWGVAYITGYFVTSIVSLGKWIPDTLIRSDENKIKWNSQTGVTTYQKDGNTYLGGIGVALMGVAFWVVFIISLIALW